MRRYLIVVLFASTFLMAIASGIYANRVATDQAKHFCALIMTLDDAYTQTPPTTPVGHKIAIDVRKLRVDLGCDDK